MERLVMAALTLVIHQFVFDIVIRTQIPLPQYRL
jgi:hypothetical protein